MSPSVSPDNTKPSLDFWCATHTTTNYVEAFLPNTVGPQKLFLTKTAEKMQYFSYQWWFIDIHPFSNYKCCFDETPSLEVTCDFMLLLDGSYGNDVKQLSLIGVSQPISCYPLSFMFKQAHNAY